MKNTFKLKLSGLFIIMIFVSLFSQNRTGNIVEYFGKEKINEIQEGELLHVFDEGLVLSYNVLNNGTPSFPRNEVFASFISEPNKRVEAGEIFDIDYLGEAMKWEALGTDSTSTFSDRKLRSGYLYLQYMSDIETTVLFECSGNTQVLINGIPHEGDHYDFGYTLIPMVLRKGINTFVLSPGRFSRMRARLIAPKSEVILTQRDMTLPDLLIEESKEYLGAIRIINSSQDVLSGYRLNCKIGQDVANIAIRDIAPMRVVKIPFTIPKAFPKIEDKIKVNLQLINSKRDVVDDMEIDLTVKSKSNHHKRTFMSGVDYSVQYFSVAPSTDQVTEKQALFLSVHGASVEAVNQANAYKKKDWGNLIAPTNRRPFGFAWEDWGRLDAMEVLDEAKRIYQPHPQKVYLTGHSMGGHGTWYLGATYPDQFAAIAPCAGYPDLLEYRNSFLRRRMNATPEQLQRFGISPKTLERMLSEDTPSPIENMINRAGNPSRTLKLERNYLQSAVYILHGEKDNVVPTYLAQEMRERLGKFHPNMTYYEYPGGTHWYGDHSVDWPPIFDMFRRSEIPLRSEINAFEFFTASPGVSSKSHFLEILQQEMPFEISKIKFEEEDTFKIETENVACFSVDLKERKQTISRLQIDGQWLEVNPAGDEMIFRKDKREWEHIPHFNAEEKNPQRSGGFKDAFNNGVILVYASQGTPLENSWYFNRAVFDAEKFYYRANGDIPVIKDTDFKPEDYKDRNVVLYGNADNNAAWNGLLQNCPVQFKNGKVIFGDAQLSGTQWGGYFIYPKQNSTKASVGVVTASGQRGMYAAFENNYLENGTSFPDFLLFDDSVSSVGIDGVKCAGFFGNDWSIVNGDFEWK